ncbi:hypothetical protein BT63DRAFT_419567 [Microthyrium microscopicum]|uniref:Uncharacterized protein n=1 Tax=Microthyrium microscopicum TaxID=703497 RepID=A0A6A6UPQ6_9PEZI|nr:hypothetical protein BT63DRAFT_419567 [Microthyrium microscopicum]
MVDPKLGGRCRTRHPTTTPMAAMAEKGDEVWIGGLVVSFGTQLVSARGLVVSPKCSWHCSFGPGYWVWILELVLGLDAGLAFLHILPH